MKTVALGMDAPRLAYCAAERARRRVRARRRRRRRRRPAARPLAWLEEPTVSCLRELKTDRILRGDVHNHSDKAIRVEAPAIKCVRRSGSRHEGLGDVCRGVPPLSCIRPHVARGRLPDSEFGGTSGGSQIDLAKTAEITVSWTSRGQATAPPASTTDRDRCGSRPRTGTSGARPYKPSPSRGGRVPRRSRRLTGERTPSRRYRSDSGF